MQKIYSKGVGLAFITALISGIAVFVNKFGIGLWSDATIYTSAKNIVAAIFLTGILIMLKKLPELKKLSLKQWGLLSLVGLIGGSVPFVLFFKSLTIISAPQAAFVHKTLFIWVALMAIPFLKEKLSMLQVTALGLLFFGVFLFGAPTSWVFNVGTLMAFGATVLWSIETIIAKKVLNNISSAVVGWGRMFIGSLFLIIYLAVTGNLNNILPSSTAQLGITLLVGLVLFGFVFSWYSSLKHAPATVVSSILVIAAPITTILNSIFITKTIPGNILVPSLIMLVAILVISKQFNVFISKFKSLKPTVCI